MTLELKDVSLDKRAVALSGLNAGLRTLVQHIIDEDNTADILGKKDKQAFFNHSYDKDPSTNGGKLPLGVSVDIYYQPATTREFDNWETIDTAGFLSGRRRLAVRTQDGKVSFYMTNHPKSKPGLRDNSYGVFTPINCSK